MFLVGQDGGEGVPGTVDDGDVEVLVTGAAGLSGSIAVDATAGLTMRARRLIQSG